MAFERSGSPHFRLVWAALFRGSRGITVHDPPSIMCTSYRRQERRLDGPTEASILFVLYVLLRFLEIGFSYFIL